MTVNSCNLIVTARQVNQNNVRNSRTLAALANLLLIIAFFAIHSKLNQYAGEVTRAAKIGKNY
ncbi:hypothetical protein GH733_019419 [Mirounga leonina]|nr:hypothetical protein GH733_019419 [Mirounga leonina]